MLNELTPNRALKNAIEEWRVANEAPIGALTGAAAPKGETVTRTCITGSGVFNMYVVMDTSGSMAKHAASLQVQGNQSGEEGQKLAIIDVARAVIEAMAATLSCNENENKANFSLSIFNTHFTRIFSRKPLTAANIALLKDWRRATLAERHDQHDRGAQGVVR